MYDLRFYNSNSAMLGRWSVGGEEGGRDDNERLYAIVPRLRLRRFCLERGLNPGSLDQ